MACSHTGSSELVSRRRLATAEDVVPAIVDQTTLHTLLLQVGSTFAVKVNNVFPQEMHCLIIGVVDHIPTVNSLTASVTTGGVLVDYQTYLDVFTQDVKMHHRSRDKLAHQGERVLVDTQLNGDERIITFA